jgi:hypothetical protein
MAAPLRELAECCLSLGVNFSTNGELSVDHCCDFQRSIQAALPTIHVIQDFAHLKNYIMETVSRKCVHRDRLGKDITNAIMSSPADGKGSLAIYRSREEQVKNLHNLWEKYDRIGGVWSIKSKETFSLQVRHAEQGCLTHCHPDRPYHTSGNENWHSCLNTLTCGNASSLTMVDGLLTDAILRSNLWVDIYNLSQPPDSQSRLFRKATEQSHHLFLLEHILRQTERLMGEAQPQFLNICPTHRFGLVPRDPG